MLLGGIGLVFPEHFPPPPPRPQVPRDVSSGQTQVLEEARGQ